MKFSWALLTFNRSNTVRKSTSNVLSGAGHPIDEVVHCDNGSTSGERSAILEGINRLGIHSTSILNDENYGCDVGYNNAIALCRNEWIIITGCDRLMPANWLKNAVQILEGGPDIACLSFYAKDISKFPERVRGKSYFTLDGHELVPAMPFGARIFHRK